MKKILLSFISLSILIGSAFAQQRPVTSTYMFNGLAINPAYAGSLGIFSATFINRRQWVNVPGAPSTQILSVHNAFYNNQVGVGLQATRDIIGVHQETSVYGSVAYKMRTDFGILSMGLSAGMDNRRSDFNKLNILQEDDQVLRGVPSSFSPNFGTGVYFSGKKFYAGISVPYLLENNLFTVEGGSATSSKENRYYYATGGAIFELSDLIKFSPAALLIFQQNNRFTFDLNATVIFENIAYAGISYRNNDAIVLVTQLILNENFRIGYAYDGTVSSLNAKSAGTHEIMLNYRIKIKNPRQPECQSYF